MGEVAKQFRRVDGFLNTLWPYAPHSSERHRRCRSHRLQQGGRCLRTSRVATEGYRIRNILRKGIALPDTIISDGCPVSFNAAARSGRRNRSVGVVQQADLEMAIEY